jgi:toxin-antitoxin system PIN domain toxin
MVERARTGEEILGLSDVALSSVIRLATSPRVFEQPDTIESTLEYLDVLADPPARVITADTTHWQIFTDLCLQQRLRGNDVPDCYLAALAIENHATLVTLDRGFGRFRGLRWRCLLDD